MLNCSAERANNKKENVTVLDLFKIFFFFAQEVGAGHLVLLKYKQFSYVLIAMI